MCIASRKLTQVLLMVFTLALMTTAISAADPGALYPPESEASDQKAGSILIYNFYNSGIGVGSTINTKINITNTSFNDSTIVHLFFVASSCSVADFKLYLTPSQTYSFLVSDFDPDITGYIMAVAENADGLPVSHNFLIGDLFFKGVDNSANLAAVAFAALWGDQGPVVPGYVANSPTVTINFSGAYGGYNKLPATVALSNIPSRAAGDRTMLILNIIGGNYLSSAGFGNKSIFGLLYDDAEQSQSFSITSGCQYVRTLDDNNPRTVPRFTTVIPAGRTGWMKLYSQDGSTGILGATVIWNIVPGTNFKDGHNLHHLTLTTGSTAATLPVFPF